LIMMDREFTSWFDLLKCTPREWDAADLFMDGKKVPEIARVLGLSPGRVYIIRNALRRRVLSAQRRAAYLRAMK